MTTKKTSKKNVGIGIGQLNATTCMWLIGGKTFETLISQSPCQFCGKLTVTALPPPLLAKQPDNTTHVCNPALGGCNHGFEIVTSPAATTVLGKNLAAP